MIWKAIGKSVEGTSHSALQKGCEDSIQFTVITNPAGEDVLICCASDGAGSAQYAAEASGYTTRKVVEAIRAIFAQPRISGIALWQMFDARSFGPGGEGTDIRGKPRGYNCAGSLDEYRRPKLVAAAVGDMFGKLEQQFKNGAL